MKQKLVRDVTQIGNGAHAFLPKEWIGSKVVVTLAKPNIKERLIKILAPHLEKIEGVYLYGSHAREEANPKSDIDILVIANEMFDLGNENIDSIVVEGEKLEKAFEKNPVLMYSIVREAKPIINERLLKELSNRRPKKTEFREFINFTKKMLEIDKKSIGFDGELGDYVSDDTSYSLFLRLRGLFIMRCIFSGDPYSNKVFKKWFSEKLPSVSYDKFYANYRAVRDRSDIGDLLSIENAEKIVKLLENELKKLGKNE